MLLKLNFLTFLLIVKTCLGLRFPKLFSDGMVLQAAPIEANIWGFLDGDSESVTMDYSCSGNSKVSRQTYVPKDNGKFEFRMKVDANEKCSFVLQQGQKVCNFT